MKLTNDVSKYESDNLPCLRKTKSYYQPLSLHQAIQDAARAMDHDRKMNSHQRRIGSEKCWEGATELLKFEIEIQACNTFEEIFDITEKVKKAVYRLGDLWSYDTALRIGFSLGLYPKEIYVQQGVVAGVKKAFHGKRPRGRTLPLSIFPAEIQRLQPYEIENFLCIWGRGHLNKGC